MGIIMHNDPERTSGFEVRVGITLGEKDVHLQSRTLEHMETRAVLGMVTAGLEEKEPVVLICFKDAASAFRMMEQMRQLVYMMGGIDPAMEACEEVAEFQTCADSADWKDAHGRLTRRCREALQKYTKPVMAPKGDE